jgi:hypothetical protein
MPVAAMSTVWICHTLECFYLGIYMFNHHAPARKFFIICFLFFGQLMVLLDFTGMKLFEWYSFIPWQQLSASSGIELLMPFPIVSLNHARCLWLPVHQ